MNSVLGSFGAIGVLVLILIAILWILLPFAVFGVKDLAKALIEEQRKTNRILGGIDPTPDTHVKCPDCRELVLMDAKKCKHCGATLTPSQPKTNAAAAASY